MKKMNLKVAFLLGLSFVILSCEKDFLDRTPESSSIAVNDLQETALINPGILDATLNGAYTILYTPGTGGIGGHNDFGPKGHDILSDILSADMALSKNTYSRFSAIAQNIITTDYTQTRGNYQIWRCYYRLIRACNLIITSLGGNDAEITDANRHTMGQVKALRGFSYFYLAQYYIREYSDDSRVLPIYIDSEVAENQAQSTTQEVYDLIIDDLTEAASLLETFTRTQKFEMNSDVAKALLAYTYAARGKSGDNLMAKNLAEEVIASGYPLTTKDQAVGGFNDVNTPSWIWGVDIIPDFNLHLWSWFGQMDFYSYSYQFFGDTKSIDASLYDAIHPNDIRKTQFLADPVAEGLNPGYLLAPYNKFYDQARVLRGTSIANTSDYVFLRVDEMYLLSAEMSAKEGMDADARNRLKDLLALRFDDAADYAYVDALSGSDLQDEIYLQTRIEFWGEGKSYLAMKRNKATVTRSGSNHLFLQGQSFPYNSDEMTFKIPQSEIQNNLFINEQN
jgi:hypothetical protein